MVVARLGVESYTLVSDIGYEVLKHFVHLSAEFVRKLVFTRGVG